MSPSPVRVVVDLPITPRRLSDELRDLLAPTAERGRARVDAWWADVRSRAMTGAHVTDQGRFWELDLSRGIAIVSMLWLHISTSWLTVLSAPLAGLALGIWQPIKSLWLAGLFSLPLLGVTWALAPAFGRADSGSRGSAGQMPATMLLSAAMAAACGWLAIAGTGGEAFLFIMGVAMTISFDRAQRKRPANAAVFPRYMARGVLFLAAGLAITWLSYLLTPQAPILFGILHLLGLATILAYPFLRLPAWASLAAGLPMIGLGAGLRESGLAMHGMRGLLLGIPPIGQAMLDYWPLLPGLGIVLLGIAVGKVFYPEGRRDFRLPDLSQTRLVRALSFLGRHSLAIYLVQEPAALAGMALLPG